MAFATYMQMRILMMLVLGTGHENGWPLAMAAVEVSPELLHSNGDAGAATPASSSRPGISRARASATSVAIPCLAGTSSPPFPLPHDVLPP